METMLHDPQVEAGATTGLLEDVPSFQEHPFIRQARTFVKGGTPPHVYYDAVRQSLPQVTGVEHPTAMRLLDNIEVAYVAAVAGELDTAIAVRKEGDTRAAKPVDLYRKYHPHLESIVQRGTIDPMKLYRERLHSLPVGKRGTIKPPDSREPVMTTIALQALGLDMDLYLVQTQSSGDLANVDYRDPYTGELEILANDASEAFDIAARNDRSNPLRALALMALWEMENTRTPVVNLMSAWEKEVRQAAERCRRDLHWDDAQVNAFVKAQMGGFDAESDEIAQPFDDTGDYTPPTLLPNELVMDRELFWSTRDAMRSFNQARSAIFADMKKRGVSKRKWHDTFRRQLLKHPAFRELLDRIETAAKEDIVTGATLYLNMAGDYGLMREDVQGVRGKHWNEGYVSLVEFADAWEDDLLNLVQDALSQTSETSPHDFEDILMDAVTTDENGSIVIYETAPIRQTMPKYHPNPIKTQDYNIGFARAVLGGADWLKADQAGWAAWREAMDMKAARAYDRVLADTKNRTAAMQAFWKVCNPRVPRPQEKVIAIARSKMGLVIGTTKKQREINWNLVDLKLRRNELDFTDDEGNDRRARLLAKLQELQIGKRLWDRLK